MTLRGGTNPRAQGRGSASNRPRSRYRQAPAPPRSALKYPDVWSRATRAGRTSTVADFHTQIILSGDSCVDKGSDLMFTFETSDPKEARRFRIAQFNGRTATLRSAGASVTGHVRSIIENKSSVPLAWVITIVPEEPKAGTATRHGARIRAFAGDFC